MNAAHRDITVAIIGAGFSGVMTAANLVRLWSAQPASPTGNPRAARRIVLIDRAAPARGPAYSTTEPHHLLNVPCARMGAWADNPRDFLDWCTANDARLGPADFAPRRLYARYIDSILAETQALAKSAGITLDIMRATAESASAANGRFRVAFANATPVNALECDAVVLCTGNMEPAASTDASTSGPIVANPWAPGALERVNPEHHVAIIGSGLTMLDVLWSLEARGHTGNVTIISRHALMPRAHRADPLDAPPLPAEALAHPDCTSPVRALRWVRARIAEAALATADTPREALSWTYVIDSLRPHTAKAWAAWDTRARRQFVRHLRAMWDVHRHRVSPHVLGVVDRLRAANRLTTIAAAVRDIEATAQTATIALAPRKGSHGAPTAVTADRVIICTGPNPDLRRTTDPLLSSLVRDGLLIPDDLGLGALCNNDSPAGIAKRSPASPHGGLPPIHVVGPLRRADLWESIAVPELRAQAAETAKRIATELAAR